MIQTKNLHMDAFRQLKKSLDLYKIIEYGLGDISTVEFLNYPEIALLSFETSLEWYKYIYPKVLQHGQHKINTDERALADELLQYNHNTCDCVLVDGITQQGRIWTLEAGLQTDIPIFIIHDTEYDIYNTTIQKFQYAYKLNYALPNATIVSNSINIAMIMGIK